MHRMRFEDEMSRFEAEIAGGGGASSLPGPPPPPAVIPAMASVSATPRPGPTIYAAAPQTNPAAIRQNKDEEEDILATLEKYEKEIRKESKSAKKSSLSTKKSGSGTPLQSKAETKSFIPAKAVQKMQSVQFPQSTQARMASAQRASIASGSDAGGLPAGVKAPAAATMNEDSVRKAKKLKRVVRTGGGQIWEDSTLKDWDPNDFRIFCGDLGNDVTDEVLARVFGRYPSFQKAKVIRDKKTNKTKGYGFVSFRDPVDFTKAMKEMNGKYVGSRPIKMRKSNWKDRNIDVVRHKQKLKQEMGYKW